MKKMTGFLVFAIFLWAPQICLSETTIEGIVVEFRTDIKLPGVVVTVMDVSNNDIFHQVSTESDGTYTLNFQSSPEQFNIKYDPPDLKKYDPAGRFNLIRVTSKMELDTIGLTNKSPDQKTGQVKKDTIAMEQNARNLAGYILAGGNLTNAKKVFADARNRFGLRAYDPFVTKFGIAQAFQKRGKPIW